MSDRLSGTVKWFDRRKGYGFIAPTEGPDVFVHYSAIRSEGQRSLTAGQSVEFSIGTGSRGPQAQDVCSL